MAQKMLRIIRMVLFSIFLKIVHPINVKMKGIQDLPINAEIKVINNGRIIFGKRTSAFKGVSFAANRGTIEIGDYCFFNRYCILACQDSISIGDRCIFGPNVVIYDHDHVYNRNGFVSGEYKTNKVLIERNCWIGANVTILRGTHIGESCVIGAGAVLQGEIPAFSVVKNDRDLIIKHLV